MLRAVLTVEPPPLGSFNPLVPDEVVAIIHRMLQKDVSKRYPRIAQARAELDAVLDQMGLHRSRDLMRECAQDPVAMSEQLKKKRLARHRDQGLYYENMGLGKIDDALLEFRRVLHLDPQDRVAREHVQKLERDRERMRAESASARLAPAAPDPETTSVLTPEALAAMTAAAPAPKPAAAAKVPPPAAPAKPAAPARREPRAAASASSGARNLLVAGVGALVVVAAIVVGMLTLGGRKQGGAADQPPRDESSAPPAAEAPAPTPAPVSTPVVSVGAIAITSDPAGPRLFLDGQPQTSHPGGKLEGIAAGPHTVRVEKSGYLTQERQVDVVEGRTAALDFKLEVAPDAAGTLVIRATPWASFYVDDKLEGTPNSMSARIPVSAGMHVIRIVNPNFDSKIWNDVRVEPNATVTLEHNFLTSTVGRLKVPSPGNWAYIVLNGTNTGKTTPFEFGDLKPGRYVVTLQRDGFVIDGGPQTIVVTGGETAIAQFKLRQLSP